MKRVIVCILIIIVLISNNIAKAQRIEQQGWVTELNSGKKAIGGVEIDFDEAVPTTTDDDGKFVLTFGDKKIGDMIILNQIYKKGYEVVNIKELELAKLNGEKIVVVMCKSGLIDKRRAEYYNISVKFITDSYKANLEKLKEQIKKSEISRENFLAKMQELNHRREMVMKNAEQLAAKFSRVNFDDVSDLYKRAFNKFSEGDIDGAIAILEEEDLIARAQKRINERNRLQAVMKDLEKWKKENDAAALSDIEATRMMIKSLEGLKNTGRIDSLYQYILKLDSTDIEIRADYARFLQTVDSLSKVPKSKIK